jgi:outer membrane protein
MIRKGIPGTLLVLSILIGTNKTEAQQSANIMAFSVQQAVDYAMAHSVPVRNALLDVELQRQSNKEVTAEALPQISGNVSVTDYLSIPTSLIPAEFFNGPPGTFIPIKFGTKYVGNYGASLQQIVFDGQVFVGLMARKKAIDLMVTTADVTKEQIKANVYKIYYQLVVAKRQIGTITANIDNYQKLLHDTKEIYVNGFAEKLDVDKVQVQLSNLETQKLTAQNQIDAGIAGLKFLMNIPQADSLVLTDTLSDEEIKSNILDESYSYQDRKEFQLLGLQADLEKLNIKRYQLSKLPTLTFNANITQNAQRTTFDFFKGDQPFYTTSYIGLQINVPFYSGGAKNAQISEARINLQKTENSIEQMRQSIDNDVKQARIDMTPAILTMDAQKKNIDLAEQVYNATKLKYEQGLGSNQEISTAQADLVTAQNNYYGAIYDAIIAKIDYLQAAGKL